MLFRRRESPRKRYQCDGATPDRYDYGTGIPLGIPGQIDGVRAMNEFSGQAASFR